jgi:hypothetical protein
VATSDAVKRQRIFSRAKAHTLSNHVTAAVASSTNSAVELYRNAGKPRYAAAIIPPHHESRARHTLGRMPASSKYR